MPNGKLLSSVDLLGPWAWKQMGEGLWFSEGKSAMGQIDAIGEVLWAVVFDHYEVGGSIQMHIAISDPKVVTRQAICAVFEYPFSQLGVKKVIGVVNSKNIKSLTFVMRLGFIVETIITDAYDMGDMYILSMTREQCRWLRGKNHGISVISSAAA
jgi:RimJ/RimL family protein N-acetyltransferase